MAGSQPFDPYEQFRFRVKWDGRYVAGVSEVSGLTSTTEVIKHRDGTDPSTSRKSPGSTKYAPITLERGVTHDPEFERWMNQKNVRKDITIELYDEAGQLARAYKVHRCWVSEFQATPDLDASANAVAIQRIKLENEGSERDDQVRSQGRVA